ncbi:TPA: alpha-1,2-fucosyltransferase [Campylobacter jejuni]
MSFKIVSINCGLGNSMFQYAFAKSLQKHLKIEVLLDKTWYSQKDYIKYFALDLFDIDLPYASTEQVKYANRRTTFFPGFIRKKFNIPKYKYVGTPVTPFEFCEDFFKPSHYECFTGYFQNPKYFQDISDVIRKTFIFPDIKDDFTKQRLDKINSVENSVFIHFRRGDYASLGWTLELNYYKKAINYILERVENPEFFVFGATDLDFIKTLDLGCHFDNLSEINSNLNNHYEDMRLMSHCKHGIVANSTYSWWSAWLGNQKGKIITAPSPWLFDNDEIICENWVKISIKD